MGLDEKTLATIVRRGVAEIIPQDEFVRELQSGRKLRLKQGFDPTRPDLHLGHVVGLRKLRQLQALGHHVVVIVGDWTAQIGDPSGQSATRQMLSAEDVRANAETYMRQFFKVVDRQLTQVVWQSEWFGKFSLTDVIRLTSRFTVAQILQRDDFAKRFKENRPIAVTEMLYPLLQAYDSVMVEADVEFGGTDQRFNCLLGRELQGMMGQRPQQVFMVPILPGTDGVQKMSKSLGNYIALEEPPEDMFGKVMSLPDSLLVTYFELLTDVPDDELVRIKTDVEGQRVNPMSLKKRLGWEIVAQFHSRDAADKAQAQFERVFQKREAPEDVPTYRLPAPSAEGQLRLSRVLVDAGLAPSASEARRLIAQGAVDIDGEKLSADGPAERLRPGAVIRVGKHKFVKVVGP
ncbi:MAG: tyrosine--tRNA ligase [Dehalococcoidia bacterium]|nr:tyrosine--tRNA ligase [Dehalococcoidia bacterium]